MNHPTFVQQLAHERIDAFYREAEAQRVASQLKAAAPRPIGLRQRFARSAGRLRLITRGAAA